MTGVRRPLEWLSGLLLLAVVAGLGLWYLTRATSGGALVTRGSNANPTDSLANKSTPSPSDLALPKDELHYIWEIEHRVLILDFQFWPRLSDALRQQDPDKLRGLLSPDASFSLIAADDTTAEESLGFSRFRKATAARAGKRPVSSDEWMEHMLSSVASIESDNRVSIKTVFLSPLERDSLDGPWSGRFLLRASGRRQGKPTELLVESDFLLASISEEVPEPACWIVSCNLTEENSREADQFLLPEVGQSYGFDRSLFHDNWLSSGRPNLTTSGIYLADYDLDGKVDVLVCDPQQWVLYRQVAPGRFEDAFLSVGSNDLPSGSPVAFADLNNDGNPDLLVGNRIYQNTGQGTFTYVGTLPKLHDVHLVSGFSIADYDRDGLLDIYVARGTPAPQPGDTNTSWLHDRSGVGNTLLRNLGNWKFQDATESSGASAGTVSCFAAVWLDANDDMWPDLFAGDEFGSPVLLLNKKDGTFESRTVTPDFGGFCMGVAAGDLDDDGQIDLYLANMYSKAGERVLSNLNFDLYPPDIARRIRHIVDGSQLWHNRGGLEFEPKGREAGVARVGWAYGPCLADLDNDGKLDIYAPAGFYSVSRTEPDG